MTKHYLFIISIFTCSLAFSQSVQRATFFSTAGDYADIGSLQLQSNIGELMADTYSGSIGMLTQGFAQPETMVITLINNETKSPEGKAYPNPVSGKLYIDFDMTDFSDVTIEVFDLLGKSQSAELLKNGKNHFELNMENLQSGIYFVRVTSPANHCNKTFKINKV